MPTVSSFNYWVKDHLLGIGNWSSSTSDISAPAGDVEVKYSGPRKADRFTEDLNQVSEIPNHLQRGILAAALRDYYEDKPFKTQSDTINQRTWSGVYKRFRMEGRDYASKGKMAGFLLPQPHETVGG